MIMSARTFRISAIALLLALTAGISAGAQSTGSYTPYSFFGVGDLFTQGSAYNRGMAGVGIAARNHRFINPVNPAAVTARDTLAFMADFTVYGDNKMFKQGSISSASNTFNIGDLIMSFPIYKSSAMMLGIMPYSNTGYGYSFAYDDPSLIGKTGAINYSASGSGAVYTAFAAAGVTFFKRLSLGAQFNFNFGQTSKNYVEEFASSSFNGVTNGFEMSIKSTGAKFGLQYEQPLGSKSSVTVGATYTMASKLKGEIEGYRFSTGTAATDSLYFNIDTLGKSGSNARLASEFGIGISYKYGDKFLAEFDYTRSDWSNTSLDHIPGFMGNQTSSASYSSFSTTLSQAFRVGFEFVPNRNDVRYYFNTVAYRLGAFYKTDYYRVDGNEIKSMGLTFGATLPIYRWYNGLSIGVEIGQRGSTAGNLIRERFVNFSIGLNIFDIWFQKPKYE